MKNKKPNKFKLVLIVLISLAVGFILGGILFSKTQPRSFLAFNECEDGTCLKRNDFLGLAGTIVMNNFPGILPQKVAETDKTLVIKYPKLLKNEQLHYVAIPKKDIKNIGEIDQDDQEYLTDAVAVFEDIIAKENLSKYKVYTYGPGLQDVAYLHFHLVAYK